MDAEVVENERERRFDLYVGGEHAGFLDWVRAEDAVVLVHTEIFPRFGSQGLGTLLVDHVLDLLRSRQDPVVPQCSFAASVVATRPEYVELVPESRRAELGLA